MIKRLKQKHKLLPLAIVMMSVLALIGGVWAYAAMTAKEEKTNTFQIGNLETDIMEAFTPEKGIELNKPVQKEVKIKNVGSNPQFVRVMVHPTIEHADGTIMPSTIGKVIHLDISSDWQAGGDGYYYYKDKLAAGAETPELFNTVKLDSGLSADYKDAFLEIQLKVEAVGTTKHTYRDTWWGGVNPTSGDLGTINTLLTSKAD